MGFTEKVNLFISAKFETKHGKKLYNYTALALDVFEKKRKNVHEGNNIQILRKKLSSPVERFFLHDFIKISLYTQAFQKYIYIISNITI